MCLLIYASVISGTPGSHDERFDFGLISDATGPTLDIKISSGFRALSSPNSQPGAQEQDLVLDHHDPPCAFMAPSYVFVTLITSDSYLPGALTLAAALRDIHPKPAAEPEVDFQTACLVAPETVDVSSIKLLRGAFDVVIGVEIIEDDDRKGLELLGKSRCSISDAMAIGVQRPSGLVDSEVNPDGPPMRQHPRLRLSLPDALCEIPSERSRIRGSLPSNQTQLISNHSPKQILTLSCRTARSQSGSNQTSRVPTHPVHQGHIPRFRCAAYPPSLTLVHSGPRVLRCTRCRLAGHIQLWGDGFLTRARQVQGDPGPTQGEGIMGRCRPGVVE